jgi:hypothetical protein
MSESEVTQTNNVAGRDIAGRDVNKTYSPTYSFGESQARVKYMAELLRKFKEDCDGNSQLRDFIDEFDYFNTQLEGDIVGLEQKLKDGNRDGFIEFALRTKEAFFKKLLKYQFSESAQRIHIYLLARLEDRFQNQIAPKIRADRPAEEIDTLIEEALIRPMLLELDENLLHLTATDINGMLYFLTGNCHIKWTA